MNERGAAVNPSLAADAQAQPFVFPRKRGQVIAWLVSREQAFFLEHLGVMRAETIAAQELNAELQFGQPVPGTGSRG